jgi:hypothetical protein
MYGLPADFDASVFVGRELEQITFTTNTIGLVFKGDIVVTVESSLVFRAGESAEPIKESPPVESSGLMALLGRQVLLADTGADGSLTFHLSGGGTLALLDDSREYESYHILTPEREIVV